MRQFLTFAALALAFAIGCTAVVVTVRPKIASPPPETARLMKEVP